MRALTAILLVLAATVCLTTCTEDQRSVRLRFRYEPGMQIRYHQVTRGNWSAISGDTVVESGTSSFWVDVFHSVLAVANDSTATLRDSAAFFFETVNRDDTTVVDTIFQPRASTLIVEPNGRCADIIFPPDRDISSVKWLKAYYDQGAAVYPDGEFSAGYSWTQTTNVLLPDENMKATTTYRVKSFARESGYDCVVIEYDGVMIIPVEPHSSDSMQTRGYDHIESDGVIYHAYKEGVVVYQTDHWVITGHRERVRRHVDETSGQVREELEKYVIKSDMTSNFRLTGLTVP